ncbi:hypothetical protein LFL96_22160 [Paraburkholderia sp. D15]|uniref:hypothetical protein n=1 Tax=Paraburkholderia sp. D15 TaxID=2880218 RepID=UPI00247AAFDF|nr:hypothetical protein [Paraburkholderia sp. D15]WGS53752.1 hypothetical protein LFL96_22160 [Paraburkholderia sp. D15]
MADRFALVRATLDEVATLRTAGFRGDEENVRHLLGAYGETSDLAELLWSDLPENYCLQDIADLLNLWAWRTNDNGKRIMCTLEKWVSDCSDLNKVWVALHQDACPFTEHSSRIEHLRRVMRVFPSLRVSCEAMIEQSQRWMRKA